MSRVDPKLDPPWSYADPAALAADALASGCVLLGGIDGGITGAIAVLVRRDGAVVGGGVWDLPTVPDPNKRGKTQRRSLDLGELWRWLRALRGAVVALERFVPIPSSRARAMHGGGEAAEAAGKGPGDYHGMRMAGIAGELRGLLAAASTESMLVRLPEPTPQQYRKAIGASSGDKEYLRQLAIRLHPRAAPRLSAKSHHNRAEALLLAGYAGAYNLAGGT